MHDISVDTVTRAQEGDLKAFEDIYKATSGFVYTVALRVLGNRHDADEVTQEVFLAAYDNLKRFRFESSLKTWMYRIAVNRALNYAKKISRRRAHEVYSDETIQGAGAAAEAHTNSDREFDAARVQTMLAALNPDQRACVILRSVEGLRYHEIAQTLGLNINTVRTRLKRAREALLAFKK